MKQPRIVLVNTSHPGNIGGVAIAIALGGPGALFWMWVVGLIGMAMQREQGVRDRRVDVLDAVGVEQDASIDDLLAAQAPTFLASVEERGQEVVARLRGALGDEALEVGAELGKARVDVLEDVFAILVAVGPAVDLGGTRRRARGSLREIRQDRGRGAQMSIKSDRWIRRMAEEHGMIEPFEPGQVRTNGDDRIVSYGTSSYGYDVRCSDEFKIFTNINSAIVDPKSFDETSTRSTASLTSGTRPSSIPSRTTFAAIFTSTSRTGRR